MAPLPKTNVRSRATGMFDRSGFGISVDGTWLWSDVAGLRTIRNSRNLPTHGSDDFPPNASESVRSLAGLACHPDARTGSPANFAADVVSREVDHNVIPLGNSLLVELRSASQDAGSRLPSLAIWVNFRAIAQADLEEARDAGVEDAETILAPLDFEIRLVGKVHGHHVADKPGRTGKCP